MTYVREDIADKVRNHTPQECQEHYVRFYLQGASSMCALSQYSKPINDHTSPRALPPITHEKPVSLEPVEQQLLGYMVLRDDFERDYDNDAESLLTRLNVRSDCDELENGRFRELDIILSFSSPHCTCEYLHTATARASEAQGDWSFTWSNLSDIRLPDVQKTQTKASAADQNGTL